MKALLVTFDKYPDLDAGAVRIHMFAKILQEAGYETFVISMGKSTHNRMILENDGINHISFRGDSSNTIVKAMYYLEYPIRLYKYLMKANVNLIIHTQIDESSLRIIQEYGKRKKIPVLYDSVEWYSESQFLNGKKARGYKQNNRYNVELIQKPEAVIAISSYLRDHFMTRNIQTVQIPVIMDVASTYIEKSPVGDQVKILYAGSPGKKDYLVNVLDGLALLNEEEREKIQLTIAGCTKEQLVDICGVNRSVLESVNKSLRILGRISREQVLEEYKNADFSVLIRPVKERYAQAGFPTKFVESMCCSTPVLCNITSDLGEYAKDEFNSVILDEIDPEHIARSFRRVTHMSPELKMNMRKNARNTAVEKFDYHHFSITLLDFIQKCNTLYR